MRKSLALLLLAASVAAGFLWMRPAPPSGPPSPAAEAPADCETAKSCGFGDLPLDEVPPVRAEPAPAVTETPLPEDQPVVVVDPAKLREEADRLIAEGRVPEGLERMRQATWANPTAKNHGDLGSILMRLTAVDEALVHLRQAAELDPKNPDRWVELANGYYRKVDPGQAWKAEKRAREAQPGLKLKRGPNGLWLLPGDSAAANP
jgi:hypothetical protein